MTGQDTKQTLRFLRAQLAALLAQVDAVVPPAPDRIRHQRHPRSPLIRDSAGADWLPADGWVIRTIDGDADTVFATSPDTWPEGDVRPYGVVEARRIGLAFLAAATRADAEGDPDRRRVVALPSREEETSGSGAS